MLIFLSYFSLQSILWDSGSPPVGILAPGGHSATSGEIFDHHSFGGEFSLVASEQRAVVLLNTVQRTRQLPTPTPQRTA